MKMDLGKGTVVLLTVLISCFGMIRCLESPVVVIESNLTAATDRVSDTEVENEIPIRKMWQDQEKRLKSLISDMIKKIMPTVMREVYTRNISASCLSSLLLLTAGLKQTKLWAFQMIDASGKLPPGFLSGTMTALGNYEECVGINVNERRVKIQGQYCFVQVVPPMPKWRPLMSLHFPVPELRNVSAPDTVITYMANIAHNLYLASIKTGLCVPSSCTQDDVEKLVQIAPKMLDLNWKFSVNKCETKESFQFSSAQLAIIGIFMFILSLIAIGTLTDFITGEEKAERSDIIGKICQVLVCFSLRVNMRAISNYVGPQENLRFLCGITTIIMIWILAANAFMAVNYDTTANFLKAFKMTRNAYYEIIMNRIIPMQCLLFFGAFVTTYKWMLSTEQSVWRHLFKAYWRYTPTYIILIGLLMLTPGWGSGPSWTNYLFPTYSNCRKNWWTNLLYINNYINPEEMCLDHSWFFAVAAQLHVLGLLILIPLKRCPKVGLLLNLFLAIISLLTVFLTNMYYNIMPNESMAFMGHRDKMYYALRSYHRIYTHSVFYCAGIFMGYFAATRPNMKISTKMSCFLWVLTTAGALAALCSVDFWSDGVLPSPTIGACYAAFSKLLAAVFLSWATLTCVIEQKGIFYDIVCWRPFAFMCRLTFIVFVINPSIVTMVFGFKKVHIFVSDFEIFYNLASLIVCNYVPAYAFHLAVESPLQKLTAVMGKTCGIKTFTTSAISEKASVSHQCEEVLTEKLPKRDLQNNSKETKSKENFAFKSNC